jgi:hypothetical protein
MKGQTFHDLTAQIIEDVFQNTIQERQLLEACRASLGGTHHPQLVPIIATGLHRRLESHLGGTYNNLSKSTNASSHQPKVSQRAASSQSEGVAIVGMSGRFPGAETLEEFWTVLENGVDLCREIPNDRFDIKAHNRDASEISSTSP